MSTAEVSSTKKQPSIVLIVGVVLVIQFCLVLLFAWPASRTAPRDVPLGVTGPQQTVAQVVGGIGQAMPGAFVFTTYGDSLAAQQAVRDRTVYAALVFAPQGATLFTATNASPALATVLSQAIPAALKQAQPQLVVTVTDLAPPPSTDPHGASLPSALIPLTITSIAAGALIALRVKRRGLRVGLVVGVSVAAGLLVALAMQTIIGGLTGSWIANAGTLSLFALAVVSATCGLTAALGLGGTGLAVLLIFFFGFPYSGATSAWQMLPTPWGHVAQFLPVGAGNQVVRAVAFFDSAGAGALIAVLTVWAVVGLLLALLPKPLVARS